MNDITLRAVQINHPFKVSTFPFNLAIVVNTEELEFTKPVTLFVGENGSGKSTLLEAIAVGTRLPSVGSDNPEQDESLSIARKLADQLQLVWGINKHRGFFLRAEDFFGFVKRVQRLKSELETDKQNYENRFTGYGRMLAAGSMEGQLNALKSKYGEDIDAASHGESFLNLFQQRVVPGGLYLLDEPETPLSPKRQLAFISIVKNAVEQGCQFIIATHSPILMAIPNSEILLFENGQISHAEYDDLEHVQITRNFLDNPQRYLQHL